MMIIELKDIVIVKNEKTLLFNHRCMVGLNTLTGYYTLYDLETGEIRGQYHSIDEMVDGCKLELSE